MHAALRAFSASLQPQAEQPTLTNSFDTTEAIHLYLPAIGRMTAKGYGVALTDPIRGQGIICWYVDRQAFLTAEQQLRMGLTSRDDASELTLATHCTVYGSGQLAVQALLATATR